MMLPNDDNYDEELDEEVDTDFELESEPSLTYAMKLYDKPGKDSIFLGNVDSDNAIRQSIMKILNTERYEHEIYSWDYGIELQDLFGRPMSYVMSEIKLRIEDALLADDRIESVDDFEVEIVDKRVLHCTFVVTTTQGGIIESEMEVNV